MLSLEKISNSLGGKAFAIDVFGDEQEANLWLREKNQLLNNNRPIDFLDTDSRSQLVENILGRIAHGIPS